MILWSKTIVRVVVAAREVGSWHVVSAVQKIYLFHPINVRLMHIDGIVYER